MKFYFGAWSAILSGKTNYLVKGFAKIAGAIKTPMKGSAALKYNYEKNNFAL